MLCSRCKFNEGTIKHSPREKWCRECNTEHLRKYRATKVGARKQHEANRRNEFKDLSKRKARQKVYYALKVHKLIKEPCNGCGKIEVEAHHDDYSKPLDVLWLCRQCHADRHKLIKR